MSPFSHSSVSSPATLSSNRSAAGTTSSVSSETIMYSSSIPTASKSRYGLLRGVLRDSGLLCGIDAHLEHFHDPVVKLVAEHRVLDAVVEVRIVVDLDQHGASVHLLDVDAVEPVADRVRGSEREIDDLARCLLHGQGLRIALLRPFRAVMIDLPMAAGHEVAAREERLSVEDADAPIELRGQERLHDDEIAARKELLKPGRELVARRRPEHPFGERAVRLLQHARQTELGDDLVGLGAVDDERRRHRKVEPLRELEKVDLVAAADDRLRIVDHDEAFGARPARETIGVMVHARRLADEERVEFREPPVVVSGQELHAEAVRSRRALETLERLAIRRRRALVVVHEDREVVLVLLAPAGAPRGPSSAEMLDDDVVQELAMRFRQIADRYRREARE